MEISKIYKRIEELGGIKENPSCNSHKVNNLQVEEFENIIGFKVPDTFRTFNTEFGAFSFKKMIEIKLENSPWNTKTSSAMVSVDYFYSMDINSNCSVLKHIKMFEDYLPQGYIPICEGEHGDVICISCNKIDYGKIYYWWHEGLASDTLYKISNCLESFILELEVCTDSDVKIPSGTKVKLSSALLKMLKRDGLR